MKCDLPGVVGPPHLKGFGSGQLVFVLCNDRSVIVHDRSLATSPFWGAYTLPFSVSVARRRVPYTGPALPTKPPGLLPSVQAFVPLDGQAM